VIFKPADSNGANAVRVNVTSSSLVFAFIASWILNQKRPARKSKSVNLGHSRSKPGAAHCPPQLVAPPAPADQHPHQRLQSVMRIAPNMVYI
jgi:hypothetical protein